jgi:hypothetical protein
LPLCAFNEKPQQTLLKAFTVMDWEQPGVKESFNEYFKKHYQSNDVDEIFKEIGQLVSLNHKE